LNLVPLATHHYFPSVRWDTVDMGVRIIFSVGFVIFKSFKRHKMCP
jgi:hypothetical protein